MLTVGAGLGYGLSGGSGVPRTRQRRERTGEQVGDCGPCGRPERSRKVGAAGDAVGAVFEAIAETLAKGEDARIAGFGTTSRPAPTGRNARKEESLNIAASTARTFKAGKPLRDAVNAGES